MESTSVGGVEVHGPASSAATGLVDTLSGSGPDLDPPAAIRQGLLVFGDALSPGVDPELRVAGMSLLERGIRTMHRAGIRRLLVVTPPGAAADSLSAPSLTDLRLEFSHWGDGDAALWEGDYLLLRGDTVHHHSSLTSLLACGLGGHDVIDQVSVRPTACDDEGVIPVGRRTGMDAGGGHGPAVFTGAHLLAAAMISPQALLCSGQDLTEFLAVRSQCLARASTPVASSVWCPVKDRTTARAARDMLFGLVTKSTTGTVARILNIRLSIPLSKVLVETGVSPNVLTLLLVLLPGLLSAYLVSSPTSWGRVALAGALWQLASILDGCDGEVARVKLAESRRGAWIDTIADNVTYLCGFLGLLVGVHRLHPADPGPVLAGVSATFALLATLGMLYAYAMKQGTGSLQHFLPDLSRQIRHGDKGWYHKFLERFGFVAKRDFSALVVALVLIGGQLEGAYWFLVLLLHGVALGVAVTQLKLSGARSRDVIRLPSPTRLAPAPVASQDRT